MLRSVTTLKISEQNHQKLQENGYFYVEDIESALQEPHLIPKSVKTVIDSLNIKENVTKLISGASLWEEECLQPPIPLFHEGLDKITSGGLPVTKITELYGAPGSGKTQMCIQFCVDVQVPSAFGGAGCQAMYISTDSSFSLQRLKDVSESSVEHCSNLPDSQETKQNFTPQKILEGVHVIILNGHEKLVNSISNLNLYFSKHTSIKLLVIDSFSFPFVTEITDILERTKKIAIVVNKLLKLAKRFHLAIVLTNQLTTVLGPVNSKLIPCLGESFGHKMNKRIFLADKTMYLMKSIDKPHLYCKFEIKKSGIR